MKYDRKSAVLQIEIHGLVVSLSICEKGTLVSNTQEKVKPGYNKGVILTSIKKASIVARTI